MRKLIHDWNDRKKEPKYFSRKISKYLEKFRPEEFYPDPDDIIERAVRNRLSY